MLTQLPRRNFALGKAGLVTALTLIVAACSGAPTAAPATTKPATAAPGTAAPATAAPVTAAPVTAAPTPAGPATFSPALLGKPEVATVKIGTGTIEANNMFPQFAIDAGIFAKYGITAEVIPFDGAQKALQAAIAGQIDSVVDSPQITLTSMTTEEPLQYVGAFTNKFLDCIVTKAEIKDANSLKGKKMAVSSLGGQSHAEVVVALKSFGLTEADAQITLIGGQGARVAALQAGSVDAIPADCATADDLVKEGFFILLKLADLDIPFTGGGVQFKRSFIEKNPNTVAAVVAAHLEAMQRIFTDEAAAVTSFAAWGQVDVAESKAQIDQFKAVAQRDMRWTTEGIKNGQDIQITVNPEVANVDLALVSNATFLDKLKALGLYDLLQVPAN
jgi:ABC-type nitrate/sulfonate/bicarbonate transport system substrate-binding protein